jgi:short-subunit dehydrogenase
MSTDRVAGERISRAIVHLRTPYCESADQRVKLLDSVVLVTGASGGVGAACATALAARGARVVVHGQDDDKLNAIAADVGGKAIRADLSTEEDVAELVRAAHEVYGRVDVVVHAAGVGWYGDSADMAREDLDEVLDVNLRAPLRITQALLGEMIARGSGHVSFVASIAGWTGVANEAVYAAAKSALLTYAESLRLEIGSSGVGVSVVSPAVVRTDFFARRGESYGRRFPRPVAPQRVAAAVVHGIETGRAHQMIPRWVGLAPAVRVLFPAAYRRLAARFG